MPNQNLRIEPDPTQNRIDIFLSYSRSDSALMRRLYNDLQTAGLTVWIDETGLELGVPQWQGVIADAIRQSHCMVVILSPSANASEWVSQEISYAQMFRLRIFPVLTNADEKASVPINLINHQRVTLLPDYQVAVQEQLVPALQRYLRKFKPSEVTAIDQAKSSKVNETEPIKPPRALKTRSVSIRTELQQKAQSVILQYAIFRWESVVIVSVTIILTFLLRKPYPWWPAFGWPLLGLLGLIALVYSSLLDAETNARVLLKEFGEQFNPDIFKDKDLSQQVQKAMEYQRHIEIEVRRQQPGLIQDKLEEIANQITNWLSNIYLLALDVDAYRVNALLARERTAIPNELEQLNAQLRAESNPVVKQQLDAVIASKSKHLLAMGDLDAHMKQSALQIDQSLALLATIYSQVQLVAAQKVDRGNIEHLLVEISEQADRLNALIIN